MVSAENNTALTNLDSGQAKHTFAVMFNQGQNTSTATVDTSRVVVTFGVFVTVSTNSNCKNFKQKLNTKNG